MCARKVLAVWVALWAQLSWAQTAAPPAAAPAPIPAEAFYRHADLMDVKLSPGGNQLAVLTGTANGRIGLVVVNLVDRAKSGVVAAFADADVREFHWVGNHWLVFNTIDTQTAGGDQRYAPGLFSVAADGKGLRMLVKLNRPFVTAAGGPGREPLPYNHMLLHIPARQTPGEESVIVGEWKWNNRRDLTEVLPKRLNIVNGRDTNLAFRAPERSYDWYFDAEGTPRVVVSEGEGRIGVHVRDAASGNWERMADHDALRAPWAVHGVDGNTLYVRRSQGREGTSVLVRMDLNSKQLEDKPFVSTPGFDFSGYLVRENQGSEVLGVRVNTDAETTVWLNDKLRAIQQAVDKKLPGRVNRLSCRRCLQDDPVVLVASYADTDPGSFYVYHPAKELWDPVGQARRDIDPRRMAQVDFHRIKARDGRELPLWLTVPPGVKPSPTDPSKAAPAVVLVHGGPWVRGSYWHWQAKEQFLASRGYVVIAPEFRGSRGYGAAHHRAGWKQWGRAMQDDVADAVLWAAKEGWIDASRVCIAGASYGGYAALMGVVRHPELYRCSVAWVAVTDPLLLYADIWNSDIHEDAKRYGLPAMLGDRVADAEMLKAVSPVHQADKLTRPLLLAFGGKDQRVPIDHGEQLLKAMQRAGHKPEYVVYPGEGHGWLLQATQRDFHERLERFLGEHLKR